MPSQGDYGTFCAMLVGQPGWAGRKEEDNVNKQTAKHTPGPEYKIERRMGNAGLPGRRVKPVYELLKRIGPDCWSCDGIYWSQESADAAIAKARGEA